MSLENLLASQSYLKGVTLAAVQIAIGEAVGLAMTEAIGLELTEAVGFSVTEVIRLSMAKVIRLDVERLGNLQFGEIENDSLVGVLRSMAVTLNVGGLDDLLSKVGVSVVSGTGY